MVEQMHRLKIDLSTCTGCQLCEIVCSSIHNSDGILDRKYSAIKVNFDVYERKDKSHVCYQCKVAHCMDHCDTQALYREDGVIKFNVEKCNGCMKCVEACPFDLIWPIAELNTVVKCDLCVHYATQQCLQRCPVHAISVK